MQHRALDRECRTAEDVGLRLEEAKRLLERLQEELEHLLVKWAAYGAFAAVARLLRDVLPIDRKLSGMIV